MDRIYRVALRTGPWNLHSAQVLLNGLYLLGWLARLWPLVILAGGLKLLLYLHRKGRPRSVLSLLRLAAGFGLPAFLPVPWAALAVVLGDLLDRCEYYQELEIPSPQGELAAARSRRLGLSA